MGREIRAAPHSQTQPVNATARDLIQDLTFSLWQLLTCKSNSTRPCESDEIMCQFESGIPARTPASNGNRRSRERRRCSDPRRSGHGDTGRNIRPARAPSDAVEPPRCDSERLGQAERSPLNSSIQHVWRCEQACPDAGTRLPRPAPLMARGSRRHGGCPEEPGAGTRCRAGHRTAATEPLPSGSGCVASRARPR